MVISCIASLADCMYRSVCKMLGRPRSCPLWPFVVSHVLGRQLGDSLSVSVASLCAAPQPWPRPIWLIRKDIQSILLNYPINKEMGTIWGYGDSDRERDECHGPMRSHHYGLRHLKKNEKFLQGCRLATLVAFPGPWVPEHTRCPGITGERCWLAFTSCEGKHGGVVLSFHFHCATRTTVQYHSLLRLWLALILHHNSTYLFLLLLF